MKRNHGDVHYIECYLVNIVNKQCVILMRIANSLYFFFDFVILGVFFLFQRLCLNRAGINRISVPPGLEHEQSGFLVIIEEMGEISEGDEGDRAQELQEEESVLGPVTAKLEEEGCDTGNES